MKNTEKREYQFTMLPTKLMMLLDNNCRSMLFCLCQLSSCYANDEGYFFRSNQDLSMQSNLSQKLVTAAIDTLYINGIIDVRSVGKGKGKRINFYKVNEVSFFQYEKYSMEELKEPTLKIEMVDYRRKGYSPSYLKENCVVSEISPITNNIDNKDNKNINKEDNILVEDDDYNSVVTKMFDDGLSIPKMLILLADTNFEYYKKFKDFLKSNEQLKTYFFENRELIEKLNNKYEKSA